MDFDFGDVGSQAAEFLQTGAEPQAPVGTSNEGFTPSATYSPSQSAPSQTPQSPIPSTTPEPLIDLEVAPGRVERFTKEQLQQFYKGHLMQSDYTRKTQALAERAKQYDQFQSQYQQMIAERQKLAEFLSNRELLQHYMQNNFPPQRDGNEPLTIQDVQQLQAQQQALLQQQQQAYEAKLAEMQTSTSQQVQFEIEKARNVEALNGVVSKLFNDMPALRAVDNMEDIIRYKVFQMQPQNLAEAQQAFVRVAQEQNAKIERILEERTKAQTLQRAKLSNGVEPGIAGTSRPVPTPTNGLNAQGKADWATASAEAIRYLESIQG